MQPFVTAADETMNRLVMPLVTVLLIDVPHALLDLAFPSDESAPISSPGRSERSNTPRPSLFKALNRRDSCLPV